MKVLNSPARVYSVSNPGPLVMSKLNIDDCEYSVPFSSAQPDAYRHEALGDLPNSASNGLAAGHNTDGFDVSTTDLTIESRYASFTST